MATTLCLDFGNTRLKGAFFREDKPVEIFILEDDPFDGLRSVLSNHEPAFSILSSVIAHPPSIEELLTEKTKYHRLSSSSSLPFTIPVGKPETVGADRLAIAAATVEIFPGSNTLSIALGSCITYNFINSARQLIGGSISPGMEMRFKALNHYTARLPLVQSDWNVPLIGYDTKTNIQSGVVLGMACEIDGVISLYKEKYGNFNAVLTGGDLPVLAPHLKNEIFADPDLIFKGLYAISKINHA
jgi:type III pantothenate kinase